MRTSMKWTLTAVVFLAGSLAVQAVPPGAGRMGQGAPAAGAGSRMRDGVRPQAARANIQGAQRPGVQGRRQGIPPARVLEELGVSKDQIAALEDLQYTRRMAEIDLHAAVQQGELELQHAVRNGDEKAAMKAVEKVNQARGEILKEEISTRLKVREILGADVLRQLEEQRPRGRRVGPPGEDRLTIPGPGPEGEEPGE